MHNRRNIRGRQNNSARRKRLFSVFLLILSIVALSGGTYAWFSNNDSVTATGFELGVTPSNSLELSADATPDSWKKNITLDDIINADYSYGVPRKNSYPSMYKPTSTIGNLANGYIDFYLGHIAKNILGGYIISANSISEIDGPDGYLMSYDLYIRTAKPQLLQINLTNSSVKYKKLDTDRNVTQGIEDSIRLAFVYEGFESNLNASVADIQGMNTSDPDDVKVWEPNANHHYQNGIDAAKEFYGLTITDNQILDYEGIKAAIPESLKLQLGVPNATYFESLGEKLIRSSKDASGTANLFHIDSGITKIRIYMWIEGQDVDCENEVSGTSFETILNFTATEG
jgi:predicted ribosomally synthesized peptide with SipW-like signal peptide